MKIKIALLQILPKETQEENFLRAREYIIKAKENRADIVLLPELWNIGYSSPQEYISVEDWEKCALEKTSPEFLQYTELAKELKISIVFPYLEKVGENTFSNSATLIDENGTIVLNYKKVHTVDKAWEVLFESGEDFPVCDLHVNGEIVKVGLMICYDREFPESARILMLNGAEIVLVPNACGLDLNRLHQFQSRAFENMFGVAMTNYPTPKNNGRSVAYNGMRVKENFDYDPTLVLADDSENIFYADFDIDELRKYRETDIWGDAYRKPRLYGKLVENDPKPPFVRSNAKR